MEAFGSSVALCQQLMAQARHKKLTPPPSIFGPAHPAFADTPRSLASNRTFFRRVEFLKGMARSGIEPRTLLKYQRDGRALYLCRHLTRLERESNGMRDIFLAALRANNNPFDRKGLLVLE